MEQKLLRVQLLSPAEPSTRASGVRSKEKDSEDKNGLTVHDMRATGLMTRRTDTGSYFMPMGMYMKESGKMIKQTERAHTHMQTVRDTKEIGEMTNNTGSESKHGLMVPYTRDNTSKGKRMGKEN
jgi:hypothetical protein